jgi:hypothetical protein
MRVNVNHCIVVKAGNGFRNLLPADGPHEVPDAIGRELIEAKAATAVEVEGEGNPEEEAPELTPETDGKPEPKAKAKGGKHS